MSLSTRTAAELSQARAAAEKGRGSENSKHSNRKLLQRRRYHGLLLKLRQTRPRLQFRNHLQQAQAQLASLKLLQRLQRAQSLESRQQVRVVRIGNLPAGRPREQHLHQMYDKLIVRGSFQEHPLMFLLPHISLRLLNRPKVNASLFLQGGKVQEGQEQP